MKRYVWIGFTAWLVATLAIRLGGDRILQARGLGLAILFAATAIAVGTAVSSLLRPIPTREARLEAAVLIVLPGILLDTASVLWFPAVFRNLPPAAGMPFAALLLWAYGIALLAGALSKPDGAEFVS